MLALVQSRLVQFIALGGLLFAVDRSRGEGRAIELSSALLPPRSSPDAGDGGDAWGLAIQDEVLYREALRLGLDRGDPVVRRRLIEKVLFLAEDLAGASRDPAEAEVRAYFESHRQRWRHPARASVDFVQGSTPASLLELRPALVAWSADPDHRHQEAPFGLPSPTARRLRSGLPELSRELGSQAAALAEWAPLGEWSLPLQTPGGWRLVRVLEREPEGDSTFDEVRSAVALELLADRRERATRRLLEEAFQRYRVETDGQRMTTPPAPARVAPRSEPSGED